MRATARSTRQSAASRWRPTPATVTSRSPSSIPGPPSPAPRPPRATGALFYGNGLSVGTASLRSPGAEQRKHPVRGDDHEPVARHRISRRWRPPGDRRRHRSARSGDRLSVRLAQLHRLPDDFSSNTGSSTDFFQVSVNGGPFVPETNGLIQATNDPQWPEGSNVPLYPGNVVVGNFTVNPLDGSQVIMSSNAGRIFELGNAGTTWQVIGDPNFLDGTYAPALTFGAPDPSSPDGVGALNNFIYAGTVGGNIFVTQTGGGGGTAGTGRGGGGGGVANGSQWTNISTGLDGSGVMQIVTDPTRGSHDAYAVTLDGVYFNSNSARPGMTTWTNITGNLFTILNSAFGNSSEQTTKISYLTGIQADWNYVIPNATGTGTHPVLYVSANSGVYRSLDSGATWSLFPAANDSTLPNGGAAQEWRLPARRVGVRSRLGAG